MERIVVFTRQAQLDLQDIFYFIAKHSGAKAANRYVVELRNYCQALSLFSERGRRGVVDGRAHRVIGYRRQASIVFTVTARRVRILRILKKGRALRLRRS